MDSNIDSRPLFAKRVDLLPRDPAKPRDSGLGFFNRSDIWQAPRSRDACQMLERYEYHNI